MKRLFLRISAVFFVTILSFPLAVKVNAEGIGQPNIQMAVMSDVHINSGNTSNKFKQALLDLKSAAPGYDAIAVVGDLTNNGFEQEYQNFNAILDTYKNQDAEKFISIGNHEYGDSSVTDDILKQRFLDYNGDPLSPIYFDKWIKGYHFISMAGELSPESLSPFTTINPDAKSWAYISEDQYQWLEDTLAINAESNKPIFVFLHQPIADTVYGSINWNAGFDRQRLLTILKDYPQAILFSGHSHYLLNHPKSIYQDGFTMVNTSSVEYTWYEGGLVPNLSQGYIVNVYDDRVELKAREFSNGTWIRTATAPIPYRESAKDVSEPSFLGNSNIEVSNLGTTTATISWDQAQDNTVVDRYIIKEAGKVLQTVYSHYWKPEEKVSATVRNLAPYTTHTYEVYALDAWDNLSTAPETITLTTQAPAGWYHQGAVWYYFNNEGVKQTGWLLDKNKWYYLDNEGVMKTGWIFSNGSWYYLDQSGAMKSGWVKDGTTWYYLEQSGAMKTGWLYDGNKWYYLEQNGAMKTGWLLSGNKWYYLDSSGTMKTGWILTKDNWYFLDGNGAMLTGWLAAGNQWYYLKPDGTMAVNWYSISGKRYHFSANGIWKN